MLKKLMQNATMYIFPVRMLELLDSFLIDRPVSEKIKSKRPDALEVRGDFLHVGSRLEI